MLPKNFDFTQLPEDKKDRFSKLQEAVILNKSCEESFKVLKTSIKNKTIKKDSFNVMLEQLEQKELLSKSELALMKKAHKLKQEVIAVDSFKVREYKALR